MNLQSDIYWQRGAPEALAAAAVAEIEAVAAVHSEIHVASAPQTRTEVPAYPKQGIVAARASHWENAPQFP